MPADSPVLVLRGVHKSYDDGATLRAVRGATLTLDAGEFAAVKGPSGCGKTTLFALIAGLEAVDEGEIVVGNVLVTSCSERARLELRRHQVGLLGADPGLLWGLSLLDNVALAAMAGGASRDAAEGRAHELLDLVGLGEGWRLPPAAVPPDRRQRAALARAVANEPALLLADEPTCRLDSTGRNEVLELLQSLHRTGQTILLATHDEEVASAAERTVVMRDGILDELGAPALVAQPTSLPASQGRVVL